MKIPISPRVRYGRFGYIPVGSLRADLKGRLFGEANLLKRLQARDILAALDVQPEDRVLDFGCGSGYFTVEMAKLARKAYGIDINPYLESISIPASLQGRLEYLRASGDHLPFPNRHFHKVLASEILPMIADPRRFLVEIRRVLKPGGRLVVCNGAGHPVIKEAYDCPGRFFRWLERRYPERMPPSYQDYCQILQASFGTAQRRFLEEADLLGLLNESGFRQIRIDHTPGFLAGAYLSWSQFLLYLRTGRTLSQRNFLFNYYLLNTIRRWERRKFKGGLLCVAER